MTAKDDATAGEHYLRAGTGTQTACSCGKSFGLSEDARQHIQWQVQTQAILDQHKANLIAAIRSEMPEKMTGDNNGYAEYGARYAHNKALDKFNAILDSIEGRQL